MLPEREIPFSILDLGISCQYGLYNFCIFCEIEYDIAGNKIVEKRSFISGDLLDKYSNVEI